ncbi:2-dehydro-3-deoxygalactonokinase [Chitinophaga rhizosphaerae]|uniref:2-dehydro-3-deoxygalactonokinase n=1 Tax=Chitinophaga rhizosphaerae TaxID=1864947 RepID=UPI000F80BC2A|nr:2-dehydro-3-deoxygalactonokinase [Chitinophaga rhizosphaerae]
MNDRYFISCDWGTSTLRLRIISFDGLHVVAEETSDTGIAKTWQQWQQEGGQREEFYAGTLLEQLGRLSERSGIDLEEKMVMVAGMATSSIGMKELPYSALPMSLDGSGSGTYGTGRFLLISGVSGHNDVMRGEETKAIGCAAYLPAIREDVFLIMPGTHPKHIVVNNHRVTGFRTFMTGEIFGLLSTESILSASVNTGGNVESEACRWRFQAGVRTGFSGNLLHELFMVRTNQLLQDMDPEENWYYLSGLMIGSELAALPAGVAVYLVAGPTHEALYSLACETLGIPIAATIDADEALIRGQFTILTSSRGQFGNM